MIVFIHKFIMIPEANILSLKISTSTFDLGDLKGKKRASMSLP